MPGARRLRAAIKTEVAAQTPVEESNRQLDAVDERLTQQQAQVVTQPREQQAAHSPPAMRM